MNPEPADVAIASEKISFYELVNRARIENERAQTEFCKAKANADKAHKQFEEASAALNKIRTKADVAQANYINLLK